MAHVQWGEEGGERIAFLREHYGPGMTVKALAEAFNDRFGTTVSESALGYQLYRFRILKMPRKGLVEEAPLS